MPTSIEQADIILFSLVLLGVFVAIFIAFLVSAWIRRNAEGISPYTGLPLRRAQDLPYESAKKILQFLYEKQDYDNRMFDLKTAAICRETGRIFPNCISWLDTIHVDWTFLTKRFPGSYVSWGSLTDAQQHRIQREHYSLEGFQTDRSSPQSAPSAIEKEYIYLKPGPLYVDINSHVLLGWQCVPNSEFEVLIVQRPKIS
jgi:hypothetical protein